MPVMPPKNNGATQAQQQTAAQTQATQPTAGTAGQSNIGQRRMETVQVKPHIQTINVGQTAQQHTQQANAQNYQQYAQQRATGQSGAQTVHRANGNGNAGRPNGNGNQYRVNDKLVLDFDLLDNAGTQLQSFEATPFGKMITAMAESTKTPLTVDYKADLKAYLVDFGKAHIMWAQGLGDPTSPIHQWTQFADQNPQGFSMGGAFVTQFASQFNNRDQNGNLTDESYIVVYDDDIAYRLNAVAYFIYKCAFPGNEVITHVTADQYLSARNGMQVLDSRVIASNGQNSGYLKNLRGQVEKFFQENSPSATVTGANEFIVISLTDMTRQWGGWNGFQSGGAFNQTFGSAFGMNGGFQQNQMQQQGPRTRIIAGAKYSVEEISNPNVPGGKIQIAHIRELAENANVIVDDWLRYVAFNLYQAGYQVELDLDISKLSPNLKNEAQTYFMPVQTMWGGGFGYTSLMAYLIPNVDKHARVLPAAITLASFAKMAPELAKDPKFPKNLDSYENKTKFEEFKRKAGLVRVINPGTIRLCFNGNACNYIYNDLCEHDWASRNNMTVEEYHAMMQNQQQNGNQGAQQQNQFQQPWGIGGNQQFFNGPQMGMFGGGMQQQWGARGYPNMMGGFQQQPQYNPWGQPMMQQQRGRGRQGMAQGQQYQYGFQPQMGMMGSPMGMGMNPQYQMYPGQQNQFQQQPMMGGAFPQGGGRGGMFVAE